MTRDRTFDALVAIVDDENTSAGSFALMIQNRGVWTDSALEGLRIAFELDLPAMHREGRAESIAFGRGRIEMIAAEQRRRRDGT